MERLCSIRSKLVISLVGQKTYVMTQEDNTNGNFVQMDQEFPIRPFETEKVEYLPNIIRLLRIIERKIWLNGQYPCCLTTHEIQASYEFFLRLNVAR